MATTVGGGFVYTSIVGPQGLDSVSGSGPPSPVLLPNLVAGWSLTSGPQQTLDSTGVISGGALDWAEHPLPDASSPVYNVNGVLLGSTDPDFPGLNSYIDIQPIENAPWFPTQDTFQTFVYRRHAPVTSSDILDWQDTGFYEDTNHPAYYACNLAQDCPTLIDTGFEIVNDVPMFIFIWRTGGHFFLQVNDRTPISASDDGISIDQGSEGITVNVRGSSVTLGYYRIVSGDITAWIAAIPWLYNGGTPRSDLEIATYTG